MSRKRVSLRTSPATGGVRVDAEGGIIRGVAVASAVEARGHGFALDGESLRQIKAAIDQAGSLPVRFVHPAAGEDALPKLVGEIKNARIDGDTVRGDVHLLQSSVHRAFLIEVAERMPKSVAMSIEFDGHFVEVGGKRVARIDTLFAADFVGEGAVTYNGLLAARSTKMEAIIEFLQTLGLPKDVTDEAEVVSWLRGRFGEPADDPADGSDLPDDEGLSAITAEAKRLKMIRHLGKTLGLSTAWTNEQIATHATLADARAAALREVERMHRTANVTGANVTVGEDLNTTSLTTAIGDALCIKLGARLEKPHARSAAFTAKPVAEMAREWLRAAGEPMVDELSATSLFSKTIGRRVKLAQSTSDFDSVLGDSVARSLRMSYEELQPNWQKIFPKKTLKDFRTSPQVALEPYPDLVQRDEGGGLVYQNLTDSAESVKLNEYVGAVKLTRQALINDDLGAFGSIFPKLADAARRLEDSIIFALLESNPTMRDSETLFDASAHSNYLASGSGAPSTSTIAGLVQLIREQTCNGAVLALEPMALVVPPALEFEAKIAVSAISPDNYGNVANPWAGLQVVVVPQLTSDEVWYMVADYNRIDTGCLYFLAGEESPTLRQETDFDTEDVKFAVRHSVAGKFLDWRGLARTDGVA